MRGLLRVQACCRFGSVVGEVTGTFSRDDSVWCGNVVMVFDRVSSRPAGGTIFFYKTDTTCATTLVNIWYRSFYKSCLRRNMLTFFDACKASEERLDDCQQTPSTVS